MFIYTVSITRKPLFSENGLNLAPYPKVSEIIEDSKFTPDNHQVVLYETEDPQILCTVEDELPPPEMLVIDP